MVYSESDENQLRVLITFIFLLAHLLVSSGLETTFSDNHSQGEEAEVVAGVRGRLQHPSR